MIIEQTIFAYDVYDGFQMKMETLVMVLDLEDVYNKVDYRIMLAVME